MPRVTKKDLKGDELQSALLGFVTSFKDFWGKYKEKIGLALLGIGVAVFSLVIFTLTATRANTGAMKAFNSGLSIYQNTKDKGRHEKAKKAFEELLGKYPNANVKNEAQFYLGNCYFTLREYDAAIDSFRKSARGRGRKSLGVYALQGIGKSYEEKGDYNSAIETYQSILDKYPEHFLKIGLMLDIGGCYEGLGKVDSASSIYREILVLSSDSAWARQARTRLNFLEG